VHPLRVSRTSPDACAHDGCLQDHDAQRLFVVELRAIDAKVDPFLIGSRVTNHIASPEISPAIILAPKRTGNFQQIYVIAADDILQNWTILDHTRRRGFHFLERARQRATRSTDETLSGRPYKAIAWESPRRVEVRYHDGTLRDSLRC